MMAASAPHISVVIPTYERRDVLLSSVAALSRQEHEEPFEVVVVVDGSTDGSAAALRELEPPFPLTVIEQPNRGRSAACNRGAAAARGELLLLLDDDMEAHPRLLAEHARSHREGAQVVLGHIPLHPDSPGGLLSASVGAWADERGRSLAEPGAQLGVTDFLTGQMSIRRELFLAVGGFDTTFTRGGSYGGEDFDLGLRLANAGYRIVFNADAISRQRYIVSPRRYLGQWRDRGLARVLLARRYPDQAAILLDRRERRADRFLLRWLRRPLVETVLAVVALGGSGQRTVHWFRRARDLQYFAGVRAAGGAPAPRAVRVLCYHSISDLEGAGVLEPYGIPAPRFRRQLRMVARHFSFVEADEFSRYLNGGGVPRRAVLLTFDDCYQDLVDEALPVLQELHVPAIAFAVTDRIGQVNEWDAKSGHRRLALVAAEGLSRLAESRVAIGSHTRTHPRLDRLPPEQVAAEIQGSVENLEALGLGRPSLLAYPYGRYDAEVERAAAEAGFVGAFTTKPGLAHPGGDPFAIPRIEIFRDDGPTRFAWKLITGRPGRRRRREHRWWRRLRVAAVGRVAERGGAPS